MPEQRQFLEFFHSQHKGCLHLGKTVLCRYPGVIRSGVAQCCLRTVFEGSAEAWGNYSVEPDVIEDLQSGCGIAHWYFLIGDLWLVCGCFPEQWVDQWLCQRRLGVRLWWTLERLMWARLESLERLQRLSISPESTLEPSEDKEPIDRVSVSVTRFQLFPRAAENSKPFLDQADLWCVKHLDSSNQTFHIQELCGWYISAWKKVDLPCCHL